MALPYGCGGSKTDDATPQASGTGGKSDSASGGSETTTPKGAFPGKGNKAPSVAKKVEASAGAQTYNDPHIRVLANTRGNRDPFRVTWTRPIPPPYVFNDIQPIRVASAFVNAPPPLDAEIRLLPQRRVSGILEGDGVYAILEGAGGDPEIVKPGSVTRDGFKVVSITSKTVKLERKQGRLLLVQSIPLSDLPSGGFRNTGMGGMQGGMQGGGGRGPGGPVGGGGSKDSGSSGGAD